MTARRCFRMAANFCDDNFQNHPPRCTAGAISLKTKVASTLRDSPHDTRQS